MVSQPHCREFPQHPPCRPRPARQRTRPCPWRRTSRPRLSPRRSAKPSPRRASRRRPGPVFRPCTPGSRA
ncbi:MAG: hypothetical protein DI576_01340 [Actinomyces sp.]|nr:MAG: hypothetical protein DI576_01340 [Actinomyces sp.]